MKRKQIAYLGPEGTFGWYVARKYMAEKNLYGVEMVPYNSHAKIIQAVVDGKAKYGIVARENNLGGSVVDTVGPLIAGSMGIRIDQDRNNEIVYSPTSAMVCGETVIPINQCLYGRLGQKNEIKRVYSHPQSLVQCEKFIAKRFPQAQLVPANSTVGGVEKLREDAEAVAIAPPRARDFYPEAVLVEEGIQGRKKNVTRFLVIGEEDCRPTGIDKTSIYFQVPGDKKPGSLDRVLRIFAAAEINIKVIESRPTGIKFGRYWFIMDIDGHRDDYIVHLAFEFIVGARIVTKLKVLGSYPRCQSNF